MSSLRIVQRIKCLFGKHNLHSVNIEDAARFELADNGNLEIAFGYNDVCMECDYKSEYKYKIPENKVGGVTMLELFEFERSEWEKDEK